MPEITNELMYEVLKNLLGRFDRVDASIGEIRQEIVSIRLTQLGTQNDIHNICGVTARLEQRLGRIEKRLDLHELAEPQRPYQPE